MGRKNIVYDYKAMKNGDMSLASLVGLQSEVAQFDIVTYEAKWTGGQATNGNLSIEYSRDGIVWDVLDFGATVNTDGASGTHRFIITEIGFKFTRPRYDRTNGSASGALTWSIFSTNKGA